ncbi:PqqD family protein [Clavibacter tessellarius]|uniref:PqqD family protein n=2 Tax=Clavibacter tessellarius TaxID=31965 RepID=UPI001B301C05|nr:PqqD family protein [Clavibacter michiganensis]
MHVVPLGHVSESAGAPTVTVQDPLTEEARSYTLSPPLANLIPSLDPRETNRAFSDEESRLLEGMARLGVVALVDDDAPLTALRFIPVTRADVRFDAALDDGFRFDSDLHRPFELSEYGTRLLEKVDGRTDMGAIAEAVRQEALTDEGDRAEIEAHQRTRGQDFEAFLVAESYRFVDALRGNPTVTFEPAPAASVIGESPASAPPATAITTTDKRAACTS